MCSINSSVCSFVIASNAFVVEKTLQRELFSTKYLAETGALPGEAKQGGIRIFPAADRSLYDACGHHAEGDAIATEAQGKISMRFTWQRSYIRKAVLRGGEGPCPFEVCLEVQRRE